MNDEVWLWLVVLIFVVVVLKEFRSRRHPKRSETDNAGEIKFPPAPKPTHIRGVPIGEAKSEVSKGNAATQPPTDSRPLSPKPPEPSTQDKNGKKPPLIGEARVKLQEEQWAKQKRIKAEEDAIRRNAAKQRKEEKEAKEKAERAKSMADAEARMAEDEAKKAAAAERSSTGKNHNRQKKDYLRGKIPTHIQRDMNRFLAGEFQGPDQSPLTYVGYHVGVVRGLSEHDRAERLEVCFRVPIPRELYAEYKHWGEPATTQRLNAMIAHIGRHADMRATQPKYSQAVAEWRADKAWLQSALGPKAEMYTERWQG